MYNYRQHREKTALRALPRIRLQLLRHFYPKLLELRRYSCVVLDNLTKKLTARLYDNLGAVLPIIKILFLSNKTCF